MTEIIVCLFVILVAPLIAGVAKTVKARLQNRRGPSILQAYYDLAKLLAKDNIISPTVTWVFRAAPFVYFATAAAAAGILPLAGTAFAQLPDMLLLIYLFTLGRFFLAAASLDAGSAFGGMGGSREMLISVLVEPALLLAMLTVAFRADSTDLQAMANVTDVLPLSLPYVLAAVAFFIVVIAETGRIPVDNPDTHLELTMVHEGMILEYSGRYLGLIHWASMVKQVVTLMLFVEFFLPWRLPWLEEEVWTGLWFMGKLLLTVVLLALVETSTNKMRLFRLPGFLAVSGFLSLLALIAQ